MSIGMGPGREPELPPQLYGYPSAVQMSPDNYINRLLAENGMGSSVSRDGFFSLEGQHGEHPKEKRHTLLKWGVGILAAVALWKVATRQKAEGVIQKMGERIRSFIQNRKGTPPQSA